MRRSTAWGRWRPQMWSSPRSAARWATSSPCRSWRPARQVAQRGRPARTCMYIHVTPGAVSISAAPASSKSKPTQHSVQGADRLWAFSRISSSAAAKSALHATMCVAEDRPVLQHSGGLRVRKPERAQHLRSAADDSRGGHGRACLPPAGHPRAGGRPDRMARHGRAAADPREGRPHCDCRQICRAAGCVSLHRRGADPRRHRPPCEGARGMGGGREA